MLIVDEAPSMLEGRNPPGQWLATQSRHLGHVAHFLCQRPTMLNPTIRGQCSIIVCFKVAPDDAELLAQQRAAPDLMLASSLDFDGGEYLFCQPNGQVTRHRL